MARQGVHYITGPTRSAGADALTQVLDVDVAARTGYPQLQPPPVSAADLYVQSLSAAEQQRYRVALVGQESDTTPVTVNGSHILMPNHGCQSAAELAVYGNRTKWAPLYLLVFNLPGQKQFSTATDAELLRTTTQCAHCMQGAGEPFDSPAAAIAEAASIARSTGTSTSGRPRSIAVADARCRASTNWDSVNAAAAQRALVRTADTFARQIAQYRVLQLAALARTNSAER